MGDMILPDRTTRIKKWVHQLMVHMNTDIIPLFFDYEGVTGETFEFDFACYNFSDMISIIPGERAIKWWPTLKAKHYLVDRFKNHPGSQHTTEGALSLCPEFGLTIIYHSSTGTQPFHDLFKSIKGAQGTTISHICLTSHQSQRLQAKMRAHILKSRRSLHGKD